MSRLIFKGNTINNFGKTLPVPYIERIELKNTIGAEDPREQWLDGTIMSAEGWSGDDADSIVNSMTKITLKLSLYFNCDDLIEENPNKLWKELRDQLELNILCLREGSKVNGNISQLIKSKKNLKPIIFSANSEGRTTQLYHGDIYEAYKTAYPELMASAEDAAQYFISQANPDSAESYGRHHFFAYPMNTQSSEVSFVGDFDDGFNRVLKVAGIKIQFFVPTIDGLSNFAIFVGTSALPLAIPPSSNLNKNAFAMLSSDLAYEYVIKNGELATKNSEGFFDRKTGEYYTGRPLRALNKKYYKSDEFGRDDIINNIKGASDKYKKYASVDNNVEKQILNIMYIAARYGDEQNLLNEFNEYRKVYPDKTAATKTGELYNSFRIALENSNTLLRRQDEVVKKQVRNIKVRDLRPFQYANVFNPSYKGQSPIPSLSDDYDFTVALDSADMLYPTVLQTTIAKYQPGDKTKFETELAWTTDELDEAVKESIESLLHATYGAYSRKSDSFGQDKSRATAQAIMTYGISNLREFWRSPRPSEGDYCQYYADYFSSVDQRKYMACSIQMMWNGEDGGSWAKYHAEGTSGDYDFDGDPPGRGSSGIGTTGRQSQVTIARHDSKYGLGCMQNYSRGQFINKSEDGKTCEVNMRTYVGGFSSRYRQRGCNGPILTLRNFKDIVGYKGNMGSSTIRIQSVKDGGAGLDSALISDDALEDKIYSAIRNDEWGPWSKSHQGTYSNGHAKTRPSETHIQAGGVGSAGSVRYNFESVCTLPAIREVLNEFGFRGDSSDSFRSDIDAGSAAGGHLGFMFSHPFHSLTVSFLDTYGDVAAYDDFYEDMRTNSSYREEIADMMWWRLSAEIYRRCYQKIVDCWGTTPVYKSMLPLSTGRGLYDKTEGSPEYSDDHGIYYYHLESPTPHYGSTTGGRMNCNHAYIDTWTANKGARAGYGGSWDMMFRWGCHGTGGSHPVYDDLGAGDAAEDIVGTESEGFPGTFAFSTPATPSATPYRNNAFQLTGFPTRDDWYGRRAPPGIHSVNFGNEIMAILDNMMSDLEDHYRPKISQILELCGIAHGQELGSGKHDVLANVDIVANKYGWFFFDMEKYHRQHSNISQYLDVPMMMSYYPEMRELMNFCIAPTKVYFRYWPILSPGWAGHPTARDHDNPALLLETTFLDSDEGGHPESGEPTAFGTSTLYSGYQRKAFCEGRVADINSGTLASNEEDIEAIMSGRPPWCKVNLANVAGWKDMGLEGDAIKSKDTGDTSAPAAWSYLMLRNLDFAMTTNAANTAAQAEEASFGSGIIEQTDFPTLASQVPDNYRMMAFNYNFYVDDDLANGQTDLIETGISIMDHSVDLLRVFGNLYEEVYNNFKENYYDLALENCAFNSVDSSFNSFFAEEMQRRYTGTDSTGSTMLKHAPWFVAPAIYSVYRDIFQNAYGGDTFLMTDDARSISDSINPRTGFLDALIAFKDRMEEFYVHIVEMVAQADEDSSEGYLPRLYNFDVGQSTQTQIKVEQPIIDIVAAVPSIDLEGETFDYSD